MPRLLSPPRVETGAGTLYSNDFEDCYFQAASPVGEINFVFIQGNNLIELWDECHRRRQRLCHIGETGFGTGLNFVVVSWHWKKWCQNNPDSTLQLHFTSVEFAPLTVNQLYSVYQGFPQFESISRSLLAAWPAAWEGCHYRRFADRITLSLLFGDGVDMLVQHEFKVDCWFLDGFAPDRNAGMWSPELYKQLALHSKSGARLATFTAAGHVRRGLQDAGFRVERRPGFNKRHMTIGVYETEQETQRYPDNINIAIIGAGYAGLHLAHGFASAGMAVDVFDAGKPMSGASGNFAHLLYLKPRLHMNDFNHFFEQAYSYAIQSYKDHEGVHYTGAVHLLGEKEQWTASDIEQHWPDDWVCKISNAELEELTGLKTEKNAIWMPQACFIRPLIWADFIKSKLADSAVFFENMTLVNIHRSDKWTLTFRTHENTFKDFENYDYVYFSAGSGCIDLLKMCGNECLGPDPDKPSHWRYPLRPIAGQSSVINTEHLNQEQWPFQKVKTGICGQVYLSPVFDNEQTFGSRFYPDEIAGPLSWKDDLANIEDLMSDFSYELDAESFLSSISGGTSATRVQTTDYLPMVGALFPEKGEGLNICTGFGAKGSMVAPFVAQILVNQILKGAPVASNAILKMISPERFAQRLKKFQR